MLDRAVFEHVVELVDEGRLDHFGLLSGRRGADCRRGGAIGSSTRIIGRRGGSIDMWRRRLVGRKLGAWL